MSIFCSSWIPNSVLHPFPERIRPPNPLFQRSHFSNFPGEKPLLRGGLVVTRLGLGQAPIPDPESAGFVLKDLFGRVEGLLYTLADAAVSGSLDTVDTVTTKQQNNDWLSGITNGMETVLKVLKDGLSTLHVPYAYGFAIILLTILVKAATFPLTKKQVESAMAMQSLAPQIKAIQERYAGDQERIQAETARLYKLAGINPLAGCLPTLATIPIWIGLYRALSNVADEGLLTEGFFWIPSLSGPTTIAARQTGSGTSWLFPFIDGHPPLGWSDTLAYLVLPALLVLTQYISIQIMQPPQSKDPNVQSSQALTKLLPLMIGYFALSVPSGLSLYWFTNNILSTAQQVWLRKLGGAKNPVSQLNENLSGQLKDDKSKKGQAEVLKSITEAPVAKPPAKEYGKPTSEGPRPGERFKQLKEQEAQRKRQREEEKRKAEEAAAKGIHLTTQELQKNADVVERKDRAHAESLSSASNTDSSSSMNGSVLNHDVDSSSDLKDDQRISVSEVENTKISDDGKNGRTDQHLYEKVEKE